MTAATQPNPFSANPPLSASPTVRDIAENVPQVETDMLTGDLTLCVVPPDTLKQLSRLARRYDDALRVAGISRARLDDDRNEKDGRVYVARKEFLDFIAELEAAQ